MLRDNWNEILIFVTGSTPQIVTETIYCLATHNPPVYPEKIYFITTSHGKEIIQDRLLKNGILKRLFDDYHIPPFLSPMNPLSYPPMSQAQPSMTSETTRTMSLWLI
jgi:CRISPR-associated protein (TIGR02584 family)